MRICERLLDVEVVSLDRKTPRFPPSGEGGKRGLRETDTDLVVSLKGLGREGNFYMCAKDFFAR